MDLELHKYGNEYNLIDSMLNFLYTSIFNKNDSCLLD